MSLADEIYHYAEDSCEWHTERGFVGRCAEEKGVPYQVIAKRDGWYVKNAFTGQVIFEGETLEEFKSVANTMDWSFEPSSAKYATRKRRKF